MSGFSFAAIYTAIAILLPADLALLKILLGVGVVGLILLGFMERSEGD